MAAIRPRDVIHSTFVGSAFRDAQMEMFLQCLAVTQYKVNPGGWTPFTWENYVARCDHTPIATEKQILEAMVSGGEIHLSDMGKTKRVVVAPGYLSKDGDKFVIADKLLKVLTPFAQAA